MDGKVGTEGESMQEGRIRINREKTSAQHLQVKLRKQALLGFKMRFTAVWNEGVCVGGVLNGRGL